MKTSQPKHLGVNISTQICQNLSDMKPALTDASICVNVLLHPTQTLMMVQDSVHQPNLSIYRSTVLLHVFRPVEASLPFPTACSRQHRSKKCQCSASSRILAGSGLATVRNSSAHSNTLKLDSCVHTHTSGVGWGANNLHHGYTGSTHSPCLGLERSSTHAHTGTAHSSCLGVGLGLGWGGVSKVERHDNV